jgi:hypothetical protein
VPARLVITWRHGAAAVLGRGAVHAGLSAWLARAGERPSRPPPLLTDPYLAQAFYVLPLGLAAWLAGSWVAARITRVPLSETAGRVGLALAVPHVLVWLVPDLLTYASSDFAALGTVARIAAPLTILATVLALVWALRGQRRGTAVLAVLGVQALVMAPWVR